MEPQGAVCFIGSLKGRFALLGASRGGVQYRVAAHLLVLLPDRTQDFNYHSIDYHVITVISIN